MGNGADTGGPPLPPDDAISGLVQRASDADVAIELLVATSSTAWKLCVGLDPGWRVLDGCATATTSLALAPHVAAVVALQWDRGLASIGPIASRELPAGTSR